MIKLRVGQGPTGLSPDLYLQAVFGLLQPSGQGTTSATLLPTCSRKQSTTAAASEQSGRGSLKPCLGVQSQAQHFKTQHPTKPKTPLSRPVLTKGASRVSLASGRDVWSSGMDLFQHVSAPASGGPGVYPGHFTGPGNCETQVGPSLGLAWTDEELPLPSLFQPWADSKESQNCTGTLVKPSIDLINSPCPQDCIRSLQTCSSAKQSSMAPGDQS